MACGDRKCGALYPKVKSSDTPSQDASLLQSAYSVCGGQRISEHLPSPGIQHRLCSPYSSALNQVLVVPTGCPSWAPGTLLSTMLASLIGMRNKAAFLWQSGLQSKEKQNVNVS